MSGGDLGGRNQGPYLARAVLLGNKCCSNPVQLSAISQVLFHISPHRTSEWSGGTCLHRGEAEAQRG